MDMNEMMKKAQEAAEIIQKQMGEAQAKLDSLEVEGVSGGGLVKIRSTAKGRILGVSIDESLIVPRTSRSSRTSSPPRSTTRGPRPTRPPTAKCRRSSRAWGCRRD
jgi:hypothetical protein